MLLFVGHTEASKSHQFDLICVIGFIAATNILININSINGQYNHNKASVIDGEAKDERIPFWNIAHMANSFKEIHESLRAGANALEIDVKFEKNGFPSEVYHGLPCDCTRHCTYQESFEAYLKYLAAITDTSANPSNSYAKQLTLIMLDLKLNNLNAESKTAAGVHLAKLLNKFIYTTNEDGKQRLVKIILSVNHVSDKYLIKSFLEFIQANQMSELKQNVGFDVSMNDPIIDIMAMWNDDIFNNSTINHIWQGDGITNCASFLRDFARLKEAAMARDRGDFFKKIYYWTADLHVHIRKVLSFGIDAIISNHPDRVVEVLNEPAFKDRYRLANLLDNPFERLNMPYFTNQQKSIVSAKEALGAVDNAKHSVARYISQIPESLKATADLILEKSMQKIIGHDRTDARNE